MPRAIFIHLPKTGGTSFHAALQRGFGADAVSPPFAASRMSVEQAEALRRYDIICGHISLQDINTHFPDAVLFTILREPIERCLSWYSFARNLPATSHADVTAAQTHDLHDFFHLDPSIAYRNTFNRQTRQLAFHALDNDVDMSAALLEAQKTLKNCAWIGRQECLHEDLIRLGSVLPEMANATLPELNKTSQRIEVRDIDPALKERIESYNTYDIALYDYACSVLVSQAQHHGANPQADHG
ncbi:hypothetical protein H4S14_000856 [Agrobacterium vitis]|nr:hypothetical protein [Agrobacterium vitis]MBE1437129.1 hypothetical protein [Agrobacterium vitis]